MLHSKVKDANSLIGVTITVLIISLYAGAGLSIGIQPIGLTIILPGLFLIAFIQDRNTFSLNNKEITLFFLFLLLSLIGVFYENINYSSIELTLPKLVAAFMAAYLTFSLNKVKNYEDYFHLGFGIVLLMLISFEYLAGNFNIYSFYNPQGSRSIFIYNANYYSYMSLFANFSMFRLHLKYKNKWTLMGLFLLPLLGLAMSFTTQSRSGLIFIIIINAAFWFWINKARMAHPLKSLARQLLLIGIAIVFALKFFTFYNQSSIQNRISESSGDARSYLFREGLNAFMEYPLTGVGLGNFPNYHNIGLFTHNSYVEALAEHGLFVGSIIIMVFVLPFLKSLKLFLQNKDIQEIKLNFLFFVFFLIYNNVYVFYKSSSAMMYFFLMLSIHYKLAMNTKTLNNE